MPLSGVALELSLVEQAEGSRLTDGRDPGVNPPRTAVVRSRIASSKNGDAG